MLRVQRKSRRLAHGIRALAVGLLLVVAAGCSTWAQKRFAAGQSHKVKQGETLYTIAKRHNVPLLELARTNGLDASRQLRIGQVIYVPPPEPLPTLLGMSGPPPKTKGAASGFAAKRSSRSTSSRMDSRFRGNDKRGHGNDKRGRENDKRGRGNDKMTKRSTRNTRSRGAWRKAKRSNRPKRSNRQKGTTKQNRAVAAVDSRFRGNDKSGRGNDEGGSGSNKGKSGNDKKGKQSLSPKLLWPVAGGTLAGRFRPSATDPREGIDIAAPAGSKVRAGGAGTVLYVGNEGTRYGLIVMLRHSDSLVTIYAHLARTMDGMETGTTIARGQTIGTVGKSGGVSTPRLHFQVRTPRVAADPCHHVKCP